MPHASFHAVSVKSGRDAAGTISSALATATRMLDDQVRDAERCLETFRLAHISHAHSVTTSADGSAHAVVTAIASYEYT
jgi:hypothetical protein